MAGVGTAVLSRGTGQLELDHGYVVELAVEGFPLLRHRSLAWNPQRALTVAAAAPRDALQVPSPMR